ncbi:hypothetical protein D3C77_550480 [compost metagenome]
MLAQHLRRGFERGTVLALATDRLFTRRGDQRLAGDGVAGLPFAHLDGDVVRVDATAAEGVAGNRHLGDAVLVQVASLAHIVVEIHIQVQARAGGFLLDLPTRLERVAFGAAPVQRGLEYHLVHFLLGFGIDRLAVAAAEHQQAFAVLVTEMHALDRCLHAQYFKLLDRDRGQGFEIFLIAGAEQQQAAHGQGGVQPAVLERHVSA